MAHIVPVRQHKSLEEMHAAQMEVRARLFGSAPSRLVVLPQPKQVPPAAKPPTNADIKRAQEDERLRATSEEIKAQREARGRALAALRAETKSLHVILRTVAAVTGIHQSHIVGPRRTCPLVKARQISMWLMRSVTDKSLQQVARVNGRTDHTTVHHAVGVVDGIIRDCGITVVPDVADMAQKLWDADWRKYSV